MNLKGKMGLIKMIKYLETDRLTIKRTKKEDTDFCHVNGGKKITASVARENIGSNAVLKKLNFYIEREGAFKKYGTDITYDEYTYRLDLD